jgi:hypothetical protein
VNHVTTEQAQDASGVVLGTFCQLYTSISSI